MVHLARFTLFYEIVLRARSDRAAAPHPHVQLAAMVGIVTDRDRVTNPTEQEKPAS
jgi:hypothetical protein